MAAKRKTARKKRPATGVSVTHAWRRWMAVTCSHGDRIHHGAAAEALRFRDEYRPQLVMHLGDWLDTTCLRSGAQGTADEAADLNADIEAGQEFVRALRPQLLWDGNHENRIVKLMRDHRTVVREHAQYVHARLDAFAVSVGAERVPYGSTKSWDGWRLVGDVCFGHGYMYNEQCGRDHAALCRGSCVFGHAHRIVVQSERSIAGAVGYSIGYLADPARMTYAHGRWATAAWQHAFAFGEYIPEGPCHVQIRQIHVLPTAAGPQTPSCALA